MTTTEEHSIDEANQVKEQAVKEQAAAFIRASIHKLEPRAKEVVEEVQSATESTDGYRLPLIKRSRNIRKTLENLPEGRQEEETMKLLRKVYPSNSQPFQLETQLMATHLSKPAHQLCV